MIRDEFDAQGYALVAGALRCDECEGLAGLAALAGPRGAGTRGLLTHSWCATLAHRLRQHPGIAQCVPAGYVAVQCTYFEKSAARNWLVPVHQDLAIPVAARVDHPALRAWSEKEGSLFVQPPVDFVEQLVAVRLHLDACGLEDGPLRVVPGTHRRGLLSADDAITLRDRLREVPCHATQGEALVMRPLLLHASSKSTGIGRRRVLHFLFAPRHPPHGLCWQHAA